VQEVGFPTRNEVEGGRRTVCTSAARKIGVPLVARQGRSPSGGFGYLALRGAQETIWVGAECNQFCHPVQRYAATQCNGMLPPLAITKGCAKSHPRRRRAVAQRGFDQDVVGVRHRRVRCGLPTIRPELVRNWLSKNRPRKRALPCTRPLKHP
jgi:hypothetical protein